MSKLIFTKAIKDGRIKATAINVGESIAGVLKDFKTNNYGTNNPIIEVQGKDVEISAAGNLKFLGEDVTKGKYNLDTYTVITRTADGKTESGFNVTRFKIIQSQNEDSATTEVAASVISAPLSTKEKLAALRANNRAN